MFLLVLAYPGCPGQNQRAVKRCVCVCMCVPNAVLRNVEQLYKYPSEAVNLAVQRIGNSRSYIYSRCFPKLSRTGRRRKGNDGGTQHCRPALLTAAAMTGGVGGGRPVAPC